MDLQLIRQRLQALDPRERISIWTMKKISRGAVGFIRAYLILCLSFVVLYPLFYMLSISFRPNTQIMDPSVIWIPRTFSIQSIVEVMELIEFPKALSNSVFLSLAATLLQLMTCSLAGYGFARFRFRGRNLLFGFVLLTILVPMQSVAIPMYSQIRFFDYFFVGRLIGLFTGEALSTSLYNTPWALFLPALLGNGLRGGLYIYVFRQSYMGMPKDLEDAAYIDGCGFIQTYTRIIMPLARAPMLVVFILSLIWYWNDVFLNNLFYSTAETLSMAVDGLAVKMALSHDFYQIFAYQQAGCLVLIAPVLLMYLFLQKYFIRSVDRTGLK